MSIVTLRQDGNAVTVTLPEDVLVRLGLSAGQGMALVDLPDGVQLRKVDAELERQLSLVDEVLDEQSEVLARLASR